MRRSDSGWSHAECGPLYWEELRAEVELDRGISGRLAERKPKNLTRVFLVSCGLGRHLYSILCVSIFSSQSSFYVVPLSLENV